MYHLYASIRSSENVIGANLFKFTKTGDKAWQNALLFTLFSEGWRGCGQVKEKYGLAVYHGRGLRVRGKTVSGRSRLKQRQKPPDQGAKPQHSALL
jgi:hypothetical protein